MDVRLSPEQQALRDSAAQVVDRLGPRAVGELDDPERAAKLDAAVAASGWRELRTATDDGAPWASGVEVALVAEELGRGLADAPFLGPTLAAELRRLAGAPAGAGARDRRPRTRPVGARPAGPTARRPGGCVAVDAPRRDAALVLVPAAGGHTLGHVALGRTPAAASTSPGPRCALDPGARSVARARRRPGCSPTTTSARWTALGLALDRRRPRRHRCRARCGSPPTTPRSAGSTARRSARSRPCSTCWPTPSSPSRGRAASPSTRPGRSTPCRPPTRSPPPRWPRPTAPGPPAPCARPPSRCTAASATPGSAWPTSTCGGRCCRPTSSAAPAPTWPGCSTTTGSRIGGARGLR